MKDLMYVLLSMKRSETILIVFMAVARAPAKKYILCGAKLFWCFQIHALF